MSFPNPMLMRNAWRSYVESDKMDVQHVRPEVADSWRRCRTLSLDPHSGTGGQVDELQLADRLVKKEHLLAVARPMLKTLCDLIKGSGFQVVLTDESGLLLDVFGDEDIIARTKEVHLCPGGNWSESSKGTNAIGTAIVERRVVQIHAFEHYCEPNHFLTCSAAPLFDAESNMTGVLDVTGDCHRANAHTIGMVVAAAASVESQLRLQRPSSKLYVSSRYSSRPAKEMRDRVIADKTGGVSGLTAKKERVGGPRFSGVNGNASECPLACDSNRYTFEDIVGNSPAMREAKSWAKLAASSPTTTVLITGATGAGKELFAQAIHCASQRRDRPFVAVNCAAVPDNLIESELFGYEGGAFTGARDGGHAGKFEISDGGSVFLDEIGDMTLTCQTKLLRFLQERRVVRLGSSRERRVDIRIIAATNRDLRTAVQQGKFRDDLYYRLNVVEIRIPSLAERVEDISALAKHLSQKIAVRLDSSPIAIDENCIRKIESIAWPGNIRELENALERAILRSGRGGHLTADLFECPHPVFGERRPEVAKISSLCELERDRIRTVLSLQEGNIQRSATQLGICRNTLYRKMKEHKISARPPWQHN